MTFSKTEVKRKALWYQYTESSPNIREADLLEHLPVEPAQFEWLLRLYLEDNLWPTVPDFGYFVKGRIAQDDIPDSLSCLAYLSRNDKLIDLADQLENMRGAWDQNEQVQLKIRALENILKAALT